MMDSLFKPHNLTRATFAEREAWTREMREMAEHPHIDTAGTICWRVIDDGRNVCILPIGHNSGTHEPHAIDDVRPSGDDRNEVPA